MARPPESACWLALTYASDLRLTRVKNLITAWCLEGGQPLSALFGLSAREIGLRFGLSAEEAEQVVAATGGVSRQTAWLERLEASGVQLVTRADTRYPRALARSLPLATQPLHLFCRGDVGTLGRPSAAVIGARDAGVETVGFARELAALLAEEGLVVVGGLGKGVGRAAFEGALSVEGGQGVAVLPMGISTFGVDREMATTLQNGNALLLSPFHPEAKFTEDQAIARNKLIVGLAEAVFVVAAGEAGVARQTADEALQLGKAVYVWVVNPAVEPAAVGNQGLIESGALPITGLPDILEAVETTVATALELSEAVETPSTAPPVPIGPTEETDAPFDSRVALELLSRTGHVPDVLAKRLRGGRED